MGPGALQWENKQCTHTVWGFPQKQPINSVLNILSCLMGQDLDSEYIIKMNKYLCLSASLSISASILLLFQKFNIFTFNKNAKNINCQ